MAKRRGRRAIVAVVIVALVAAAVWFGGNAIAGQVVQGYIRSQVVAAIPGSDPSVTVAGRPVVVQLLEGSLDSVSVSVNPVTFGTVTGGLHLVADHVPVDTAKPIKTLTGDFTLDNAQAQTVLAKVLGFGAAQVELRSGGLIAISSTGSALGQTLPVTVVFSASAAGGTLVLTAKTLTVNGASISVDAAASSPFGSLLAPLLKPQQVCVASFTPKAVHLTAVTVASNSLTLSFVGENVALTASELSKLGSCG